MKFDDILAALPTLTPEQRAQIVLRCGQLPTKKDKPGTPSDELLWRQYARVLEEKQQLLIGIAGAKKLRTWPAFRNAVLVLEPWVTKHFDPKNEIQRTRAWRTIAEAVCSLIARWEVPWTPSVLMGQTTNATQAMETMFPGYAANGLLRSWVLTHS